MRGTPRLAVTLLGPPGVTLADDPVEFDTRKALGLLAYLTVEQKASRDTLSFLFWSESAPDRARATLRRTLSSLRSGIGGDAIVADRHDVRLESVESDLARFHEALSVTSNHGHDPGDVCPDCLEPLEEATSLYRGDFLEGFSIRDAVGFEEWERVTGEELRLEAGQAFHRLAMAHAANGDFGQAIAAVSRWIELDPLHEPAQRLLMLLNAWAGDRPGAVAAYRDFVVTLDRELAVPPLEETTELYEAILDEDLPPPPSSRRAVRPRSAPRPVANDLIDRADEMNRLREELASSQVSGAIVCLRGGPWMGKTRLLEELTSEATTHKVLMGRAYRAEQSLPFGVVGQLISKAAEIGLPDETPEWVLNEAARIVPTVVPGGPRAEPDPFGELRLMEAIFQLLTLMAADDPILLSIDDVQWLDEASASFVSYLLARISEHPILLVATLRTNERTSEEVRHILSSAQMIELGPLEAGDLATTSEDPSAVIRATGGIPLLVAEHLAGRPDSSEVARFLQLRMEAISDLGRQVLSTAAVLSGSCDFNLLKTVSGRSEEEVVDAVDELVVAGLLREIPGTETVTLALDALETLAYDGLTLARRRLLHKRVGEALSSSPWARSDARIASQIALQFRNGADDRATEWYRLAGDLARSVYANQEAATLYESALALGADDVGELHLAIAELAMTRGDYEKALISLTHASARSEGATLGRVEHRLGEAHRLLGRFDVAAEYFERAIATHPEPGEVYSDWALLAFRLGDVARARELGGKALEAVDGNSEPSVLARVHNVNGVIAPTSEEAIAHLDEAIELSKDDAVVLMAALNNKAHVLADAGDHDGAVVLVEQAIELASRTGHRHREAVLRDFLADLYHRSNRSDLSRASQTEAMRMFADLETGSLEPELWLLSRW